jgi:hypothetical protein
MKGIIFNAVADAVIGLGGEDLWDELLEAANLGGAYTSLGSYPDAELFALVEAASNKLEKEPADVLAIVGELAFPHLSGRHPELVGDHTGAISLLCTLNDVIHPEVLKLYPDASCPDFTTLRREDNELDLLYRSERRLPQLAIGLIRGAANLYEEEVAIDVEEIEEGFILRMSFQKVGAVAPSAV